MKADHDNGPAPERLRGASRPRAAKRLFLATRPMFFPASVLPVLLGTAWGARAAGELDGAAAVLALLATVLVHAGANVINDVYDDVSGTDPVNTARIYPYTGGSRFIQAGILNRAAMRRWGSGLLATAALFGLALAALKGPVVIALGLAGGALGVLYSVPPVQLSARGLGEVTVGIGFGVLPVVGAAWLQGGQFGSDAFLLSLPVALWVFNILLINEIPDMTADAAVGKRTLPVRWGRRGCALIYAATNLMALVTVLYAVGLGLLPLWTAGLSLLLAGVACLIARRLIGRGAERPVQAAAIKTTLAIHTVGVASLIASLWP